MRSEFINGFSRWGWWFVPSLLAIGLSLVVAWIAFDPGLRSSRLEAAREMVSSDAFGQRVRDYLLEHPEVIMEAVDRLEARNRAAEASEAQEVLKSRAEEIFRDPASPVGGNPEGDVTVVEFFDYNCPYCRQVAPVLAEAQTSDPKLRIVYKEIPILGPKSVFAAKAALAAHRQGLYLKFHTALMHARARADEAGVLQAAAEAGLDVSRLKSDMEDAAIQADINRNLALAQALRITGTPGFVIGRQIVRGAIDAATLRNLIDKVRKEQAQ